MKPVLRAATRTAPGGRQRSACRGVPLAAGALLACVGLAVALLRCGAGEPAPSDGERLKRIDAAREKLRPLHTRLGKPRPGDWLERFKEPGQTFNEYLVSKPVTPQGQRSVLYIQPLGAFDKKQREIVELTAEFMRIYFSGAVKVKEDISLDVIPEKARRVHPTWGVRQILAGYVLDEVLKPRLPKDAAAYIAFTASDLWPGEGWNFVFGMASLRERVGVWSINRNGDSGGDAAAFRLCLMRTLKTATHETGHMFSIAHCTAYECNMCGSNSREEADRRPVFCCPECAAKIWWACRADPVDRYRKLWGFFEKQGFKEEGAFCRKSVIALGGEDRPADAAPGGGGQEPGR